MGSSSPSSGDVYDESYLYRKDTEDWDPRFGAPIRPAIAKRKCVSVSVQTSPIEEICPPLCRDTTSNSSSPDPESDPDDAYAGKRGLKRTQSGTGNQVAKKARSTKSSAPPAKPSTPKQPRRDTIITLDGAAKPRSIYAPSPTPLQCTYVYPLALGPPRRPIDLRRNKGAKATSEPQMAGKSGPHVASADPAASEDTSDPSVPAEDTQMEVDDSHKITHRCPITFAREFEMRRHIRTVHIAEEVRAVVEGRLARSEATVIPENWDGKTLISKPTCAGCGTTFSRPDAVRRHQTEVNAKIENGICVECPGPKVHIRRGPRKDIQPGQLPTPIPSPIPVLAPPLAIAPAPPVIAPAPAPAVAPTHKLADQSSAPPAPVVAAVAPGPDAAPMSTIPTSKEPQPQPVEGELESEDDIFRRISQACCEPLSLVALKWFDLLILGPRPLNFALGPDVIDIHKTTNDVHTAMELAQLDGTGRPSFSPARFYSY
ncbi:hypothetical protein CTheo_3627 [Ceratobasidium theobromae]|uniref:C2H2-type domain-containing protein n=1 Tax=Ceratobasidium theobromae TaxID=1582974 RepID=A0A5N5QP47_9AGAM|nr:hypothetical protein CTheo_3627 [Ceratobasidium theobromae]